MHQGGRVSNARNIIPESLFHDQIICGGSGSSVQKIIEIAFSYAGTNQIRCKVYDLSPFRTPLKPLQV